MAIQSQAKKSAPKASKGKKVTYQTVKNSRWVDSTKKEYDEAKKGGQNVRTI